MPLTNSPNLLIVDDNKENLAFLRSIMRNMKVNLIQALSGPEALEKIQGIELALAIIDVQMPGMNGYELAKKINTERADAKVPIIFLTASYLDDLAVLTGYNSGAVDYIIKPVKSHILLSKINVFLDLFIQKQTVIQNITERKQVEEKIKQLNKELEDRVIDRTAGLVEANTAIKQIKKNYETFFNSIDDFVFVIDVYGNIIHTNSTVIKRLGYTSKELIGKSILMVHPSECRDEAGRIVCKILSEEKKACSVPLITKSGIHILAETKTSHGIWNGEPVIFSVTKDISKIKLSEEKFSKAFHINPLACSLSNLDDHRYVEVNEAFYTLFGFDISEVLGNTAIDLGIMTTETRNAIIHKADYEGKIRNIEADLKAKSGEIKHVTVSSENIKVQDKNYRFTVVHDFTKHKLAEKALKESEAMLKKAQQIAHIGSWELDERTQELHWSDETFRMFGYTPCAVKPTMELFMQRIHPESLNILLESITASRKAQKPYSVEHQIFLPDGQLRFVHEQAEIILNDEGKPEKWIGTVQDITEKKQIQKNIVKAIIETEEKERAYFAKELHDGLGPLLSTIKLYLQWSERPKSSKSQKESIQKAEEVLEGALTTVKEISNKLSPHLLRNYGLSSAIKSFIDQLGESCTIRIAFQSNTIRRFGLEIESLVYRTITECINNTIKHAKAHTITIMVNDAGSHLNIGYSDDGIGFDINKILSNKKGLGLFNLQNRIETVGGSIKMFSEPGLGVDYQIKINL
jgi:PAS domain S-box-containing protein